MEAAEEPTYFYSVHPGRDNNLLFLADKDEEGFEKSLEVYSPSELECEPELGEVAAEYGISAGGMTPERSHTIALMGLEAIEEQHFKDIVHEPLAPEPTTKGPAGRRWQGERGRRAGPSRRPR